MVFASPEEARSRVVLCIVLCESGSCGNGKGLMRYQLIAILTCVCKSILLSCVAAVSSLTLLLATVLVPDICVRSLQCVCLELVLRK